MGVVGRAEGRRMSDFVCVCGIANAWKDIARGRPTTTKHEAVRIPGGSGGREERDSRDGRERR